MSAFENTASDGLDARLLAKGLAALRMFMV